MASIKCNSICRPRSRLFGLNYLVLGAALTIIITLFRFNLVQRAVGL